MQDSCEVGKRGLGGTVSRPNLEPRAFQPQRSTHTSSSGWSLPRAPQRPAASTPGRESCRAPENLFHMFAPRTTTVVEEDQRPRGHVSPRSLAPHPRSIAVVRYDQRGCAIATLPGPCDGEPPPAPRSHPTVPRSSHRVTPWDPSDMRARVESRARVSIGMAFRRAHGTSSVTSMNGRLATNLAMQRIPPVIRPAIIVTSIHTSLRPEGSSPAKNSTPRLSQCPHAPIAPEERNDTREIGRP
jgi:hypothetical protein